MQISAYYCKLAPVIVIGFREFIFFNLGAPRIDVFVILIVVTTLFVLEVSEITPNHSPF